MDSEDVFSSHWLTATRCSWRREEFGSIEPLATLRRFIVRNPRCAIVAVLLTVLVAGCGGAETKPVQYNDLAPYGGMKEQMTKNMSKNLKKPISVPK
jgi:hypothetical protein